MVDIIQICIFFHYTILLEKKSEILNLQRVNMRDINFFIFIPIIYVVDIDIFTFITYSKRLIYEFSIVCMKIRDS